MLEHLFRDAIKDASAVILTPGMYHIDLSGLDTPVITDVKFEVSPRDVKAYVTLQFDDENHPEIIKALREYIKKQTDAH